MENNLLFYHSLIFKADYYTSTEKYLRFIETRENSLASNLEINLPIKKFIKLKSNIKSGLLLNSLSKLIDLEKSIFQLEDFDFGLKNLDAKISLDKLNYEIYCRQIRQERSICHPARVIINDHYENKPGKKLKNQF
jgi:hypothetical protein